MNRRQKITLAASGVVVAGLFALAVPALGTIVTVASGVHETAQSFRPVPSYTPTPAASPEVPTLIDPVADAAEAADADANRAPLHCDTGYTPKPGSTPYDQGPRARATGEVEVVDGVPTSYTVASNDSIVAIGGRFCIDYSTIVQMTDSDMNREIYPGDVLALRP